MKLKMHVLAITQITDRVGFIILLFKLGSSTTIGGLCDLLNVSMYDCYLVTLGVFSVRCTFHVCPFVGWGKGGVGWEYLGGVGIYYMQFFLGVS